MLPVRFLGRSGVNGEQLTECKVRDIELVGSGWVVDGDEVSENSEPKIYFLKAWKWIFGSIDDASFNTIESTLKSQILYCSGTVCNVKPFGI